MSRFIFESCKQAAKSKLILQEGVCWRVCWRGGEEVSLPWCLYFFHFCFAWAKWNTIGWKAEKARKLSISYVWWEAIRSWSCNLQHIRTIKKVVQIWSQRKSECVLYRFFNNVPVYFWLNFKLEGAGNSCWKYVNQSRCTCCVADSIIVQTVNYYKHIWSQTDNKIQHGLPVKQHHQTPDC